MTATDLIGPPPALPDAPPAADDGGILPPYSGADAVCPKCLYGDADTEYKPPIVRMTVDEHNGRTARRGPLPERLERRCIRCDYRWDEALVADADGMTVDALTHALDNALPYPVELDRPVLEAAARELLKMLRVVARPDHPLWQYSQGTPPVPVAPTPCEELHPTPEDEDACERRRAPKEITG
ncbi:hypothetical protein GR925_25855 [Streptomyces sp. HUCO-GS316]|uniref:hypothetical protein n=1 Tax=Streptomyces sp. HUCO-GS316 TaxID=2692198 RepID=UPI001368A85E|nr:hypothetical protein [Streptomyces sp. HUCO-GS316]MXM66762.1 hypothetical protein [Streptomyces sp. HUCO-GS316]